MCKWPKGWPAMATCSTRAVRRARTNSGNLKRKIHRFASWAVKLERRKGSSRWQKTAYGGVNEVALELLRSARSPKRENGCRMYIKHDKTIASPLSSCLCYWQLPMSPPVQPLSCSAPHSLSLSLSISDQVWCIQRSDCVKMCRICYKF